MERPVQSPTKGLSRGGPAEDESGLFSGGSVLKLQKLIFAGSPLSEVLTPCTHSTALSESKGQNVNPTRRGHGSGCDWGRIADPGGLQFTLPAPDGNRHD